MQKVFAKKRLCQEPALSTQEARGGSVNANRLRSATEGPNLFIVKTWSVDVLSRCR